MRNLLRLAVESCIILFCRATVPFLINKDVQGSEYGLSEKFEVLLVRFYRCLVLSIKLAVPIVMMAVPIVIDYLIHIYNL